MNRQEEKYLNEGLEIGREERDALAKLAAEFLQSYNSSFGAPEKWQEHSRLTKALKKLGYEF